MGKKPYLIEFKQNGDEKGHLVAVEGIKDIPFEIKRVFYIYGSNGGVVRGKHANLKSEFVLINIAGSCKVKVKHGTEKEDIFVLDKAHIGIYLPRMVWKEMYDFSPDSVLLCLASEYYVPDEYIRDYNKYIELSEQEYRCKTGDLISGTAIIEEGAIIEKDVIIHDYAVIHSNVIVKSGAEIFEHAVLGKEPKSPGCTARPISADLGKTVIGENTILSPGCVVYLGTTIGKNTLIGDNCSIREECIVGDSCIIGRNVSINYNTKIGSKVKIMDNAHITGNMVVEDDVFIAMSVVTSNDNRITKRTYMEERAIGPHIKKGATIGAGANILPGVIVGENCMVAAGAVVTKDVPAHKVVMGIPAKVVKDIQDIK